MIELLQNYLSEDPALRIGEVDENLTVHCKYGNFAVLKNRTWEYTKKYIEKIKEARSQPSAECVICYERDYRFSGCAKCYQRYCLECLIKIMQEGQGIFTCPFCSHKVGQRMNRLAVDIVANRMRSKYIC